jgi:hypothetical protein
MLYYFLFGAAQIIDIIDSYSRDNIGVDGVRDVVNYPNAQGWSQILDTGLTVNGVVEKPNRVPEAALPWLGQFVGVRLDPASTAPKSDKINKIQTHSSFQRGTVSALISSLIAALNAQLKSRGLSVAMKQVIVMEQTQYVDSGYNHADYAFTILLPRYCFNLFSYQQLETIADTQDINGNITYNTRYSDVETYVQSIGGASGSYSGLNPSTTPTTNSKVTSYIYRYRPAGLIIYIGGY